MTQENPRHHGFSLVELMVAMLCSFLAISAIYAIFSSQNQAAIKNDSVRELNGVVNTSFNLLVKSTRMAGYRVPSAMAVSPFNNYGVTGGQVGSNLNGSTVLKTPLTTSTTDGIKTGTDGVLVLQADNLCEVGNFVDNSALFTNGATGTAKVCEPNCFTSASNPYVVGDVLLVDGPTSSTAELRMGYFVKVTGVTQGATGACSGATNTTVTYAGLEELNFWACPGGPPSCAGTTPTNQEVFRLGVAHLYYVNKLDQLARLPINNTFSPEIVSDGVEDLQITYDETSTCTTAQWCTGCSECNAKATQLSPPSALREIRALRVGLVTRTLKLDETEYLNKGHPLSLFDHTVTLSNDSYRRRVITEMVVVKNLELLDF